MSALHRERMADLYGGMEALHLAPLWQVYHRAVSKNPA
jgi:hypothetical protein